MSRENCEVCGDTGTGQTTRCYIVPEEITEQAGVRRSKTIWLCPKCQSELDNWYSANIADMTFDTMAKQFLPKSALQLVKEYETAYQWFVHNKKEQPKKQKPRLL